MKKILPIVFLVLLMSGCGGGKDKNAVPDGPLQRAEDVIISESEMGTGNWLLTTKKADFYDDDQYVKLTDAKLIFKKDGQEDTVIRADEGRYDISKHLIGLMGNVTGLSIKEGSKIKTEIIYYDTETKKIWTNVPVTVTRGGVTVKGEGVRANSDFSEIELFKQKTQLPKDLAGFDPYTKTTPKVIDATTGGGIAKETTNNPQSDKVIYSGVYGPGETSNI